MSDFDLERLNDILADQPYVSGYLVSATDFQTFGVVGKKKFTNYPHIRRWFVHISSFTQEDIEKTNPETLSKMSETLSAENLPQFLLERLNTDGGFNSIDLAGHLGLDHQKIIGAIKSLLSHEGVLATEDVTVKKVELSAEGKDMAQNGSAEFRVFLAVGADGRLQDDIKKESYGKVGLSKALAAGWVSVDKSGNSVKVVRKIATLDSDVVSEQLKKLDMGDNHLDEKVKAELKKRKLISETTVKGLNVEKGLQFTVELSKPELDLTPEMIASGSWKAKSFKKYNFEAMGIQPPCGHLHPLLKSSEGLPGSPQRSGPNSGKFSFLWASLKCPQIAMLRVLSGTLMLCSNLSNILLAMHMILSSYLVGTCYYF